MIKYLSIIGKNYIFISTHEWLVRFLGSIFKPFLGSLLMGLSVFALIQVLPISFPALLLEGIAGAIIYLGAMYLLARKELLADLRIVIKTFRK